MKRATRPYVMKSRAESAASTRARIVASAVDLLFKRSLVDVTIDAIADGAGVTARTVLRAFPNKETLFAEAAHWIGEVGMAPIVPDLDGLVAGTYSFYERVGDTVIRWLADEPRLPFLSEHLKIGRQHLRAWVSTAFATPLAACAADERARLLDALIVAFDVYVWKLLRRDFGLPQGSAEAVVKKIVSGLLREVGDGEDALAQLVGRRQPAAKPRNRARVERTRP